MSIEQNGSLFSGGLSENFIFRKILIQQLLLNGLSFNTKENQSNFVQSIGNFEKGPEAEAQNGVCVSHCLFVYGDRRTALSTAEATCPRKQNRT